MARPHAHRLALALFGLMATVATAHQGVPQPDPQALARAQQAIEGLASDAWAERVDASARLLELARDLEPALALTTLEAALERWIEDHHAQPQQDDGDLAEVLARFELAAMIAFQNAPRAGLGITYDTNPAPQGVRLGGTVRGFDAYDKLREGDVILALSGTPVQAGSIDLPVAIASFLPGETATVELLRDGQPLTVRVTMGRRDALNTTRQLPDDVLRRAWAVRMDRRRPVQALDKLDTDRPRTIAVAPPSAQPTRVQPVPADVTLGGEPAATEPRIARPFNARIANDAQEQLRAQLDQLNAQLAQVVRKAIDTEEDIRQLEVELRLTPGTLEGQALRDQLRQRIAALRQQLAPLQQEQTRLMQQRMEIIRALSQ